MSAHIHHDAGMVPIQITAYLAERLMLRAGDLPQIDGILAYCRLAQMPEAERPDAVNRRDVAQDLPVRLAKWALPASADVPRAALNGAGELWGYVVTEAQPVGDVYHGTEAIRRLPDVGAIAELTDDRRLEFGSGALKAYDLRLPTAQCSALRWWVFGHWREIRRRYLRLDGDGASTRVVSLGGKRGMGFGRVLRWEVEHVEVDAEWVLAHRWMPEGFRAGRTAVRGVRPPYWHPDRQVVCVEPIGGGP